MAFGSICLRSPEKIKSATVKAREGAATDLAIAEWVKSGGKIQVLETAPFSISARRASCSVGLLEGVRRA